MLPHSKEQPEALERAVGPPMPEVRDVESRLLQNANELVDREARDAIARNICAFDSRSSLISTKGPPIS